METSKKAILPVLIGIFFLNWSFLEIQNGNVLLEAVRAWVAPFHASSSRLRLLRER